MRISLPNGLALLALGCLGLSATAWGGYLRYPGPPPLRWGATPLPRPEVLNSLPPLKVLDDPPPSNRASPVIPLPGTNDVSQSSGPAANPDNTGVPPANSPMLGPVFPLPSDLAALFYAPPGTNSAPPTVMPLQFVPPPQPNPPSSSTTFSHDKP